MRAVTKYEADDGVIFATEQQAISRDVLIAECESFKALIGIAAVKEVGSGFSSGGGFIQHSRGTGDRIHKFLKEKGANRDTDGPVGRLIWLWQCLDEQDRQWGQPYFAIHPDKGQQVEVTA